MIAGVFPPLVGGIQTHVSQLSRKLVERGVEVHVLTRHLPGLVKDEDLHGIRVHRVGNGNARRGVRAASYLFGALQKLRELGPSIDLIHAHELLQPAAVAMLGRMLSGKPLVINPHNDGEVAQLEHGGLYARTLLSAARRRSDAFISICRPVRQELERIGVAPARIYDIGNGVDTRRFRPASREERLDLRSALGLPRGPLVMYTGRLAAVKGVDVLLQAWPRVAGDAHLCIVGDGEDRESLEAQAASLPRVQFFGAVSDVTSLMRAADVCVLPSRAEGLPIALLESMSAGLPVVAAAVGGIPDAVEDGVSGLLVPPADPAALAEGVRRALGAEGDALGRMARARILERYSIDAVTDRVLDLYATLVREPARARAFGIAR